jgi:hypothetical protein
VLRRPRDLGSFLFGAALLTFGVVLLLTGDNDDETWILLIAIGAGRMVASFFFTWSRLSGGKEGPGPLDATGTGRFRASGWPPSKDPGDYR